MRIAPLTLVLAAPPIAILTTFGCRHPQPLSASPAPVAVDGATVAIVDVGLISMEGAGHGGDRGAQLVPHQTVVLAGERILAVGAVGAIVLPDDVRCVDGSGKFLVPGLADMHEHLPRGEDPGEFATDDYFDVLLTAGVTTIRTMRGAPTDIGLRDAIDRGERTGPRLIVGSPGVNAGIAPDPETARTIVNEFKASGYDFLKILGGFSLETFEAMASEANAVGLPMIGHLPNSVSIDAAIAAPFASIEHLHGHGKVPRDDPDAFADLARRTRDAGVWVCPTLGFQVSWYGQESLDDLLAWPGIELAHPDAVDDWIEGAGERLEVAADKEDEYEILMRSLRTAVRGLADAGVGMLVSSSGGYFLVPGYSMFVEFDCLTDAGLTPAEILTCATVNAARSVGEEDEWGSIIPGLAADLVLLDANPLEDIDNAQRIAAVVRRGEVFDREELDRMLRSITAKR